MSTGAQGAVGGSTRLATAPISGGSARVVIQAPGRGLRVSGCTRDALGNTKTRSKRVDAAGPKSSARKNPPAARSGRNKDGIQIRC
ncbi:hypothetical protein NDU88_002376 [Pleurodeles waltl]|uniref:Uncharacterized protein n=1 Tax=Pleurodeles waltl TaxID=8319 RepID=A0AAV7MVI4_PLEWA|nr:hypothetical protein NDU88_002376 [Pleurodeles waltl]